MMIGYDIDESVLDDQVIIILLDKGTSGDQIIIRNERELFEASMALLDLYRRRMENK